MIRCAGVPGLLPDAGGELSRFLERYLPLQELLFSVAEPARHELGIVSPTKDGQDGIVLPFPDPCWPRSPQPRLNTLYWPTGASRWAHCLLLVDTDGKEEIVAAAHDNGRANVVTLEMSTGNVTVEQNGWGRDGQDVGLSVDMYVLKPRPVSITQTPEARHLWLVPLVDERYLWQWKPVGTLSTADIPDWEALLQVVADAIGEDLIGNVVVPGSEFNWKPDIEGRTALDHMNAAILLDAVAQSIGRRVVRQLDGDLQVLAATQGTTNWDNSYRSARDTPEEVWYRLAGEEFHNEPGGAGVPEEFVVLFHSTGETAAIRAEDVDGTEWTPGFSRLFRVPYTPDNFGAEARTDLAEALARAYYTWQHRQGSLTFAGVKAWKFGGCEDALTITLGELHQGEYLAQTHVRSLPPNFGIRSLVSSGSGSGSGSGGAGGNESACCGDCRRAGGVVDCAAVSQAMTHYHVDILTLGGTVSIEHQGENSCTWQTAEPITVAERTFIARMQISGVGIGDVSLSVIEIVDEAETQIIEYINTRPFRALCKNVLHPLQSAFIDGAAFPELPCQLCLLPTHTGLQCASELSYSPAGNSYVFLGQTDWQPVFSQPAEFPDVYRLDGFSIPDLNLEGKPCASSVAARWSYLQAVLGEADLNFLRVNGDSTETPERWRLPIRKRDRSSADYPGDLPNCTGSGVAPGIQFIHGDGNQVLEIIGRIYPCGTYITQPGMHTSPAFGVETYFYNAGFEAAFYLSLSAVVFTRRLEFGTTINWLTCRAIYAFHRPAWGRLDSTEPLQGQLRAVVGAQSSYYAGGLTQSPWFDSPWAESFPEFVTLQPLF